MSFKWPFKDPDKSLYYSIDWSRFLGDDDTIASVQWYVDDSDGTKTSIMVGETVNGLTLAGQSTTDTVATVIWSGGTANTIYKITCAVSYGDSLVVERTIQLPVRER